MTEKNIQIQDLQGNNLFPKTKAAVVINNQSENLGDVEAGAQVNKIEKIKINGVEVGIVSKVVDITIPAAAEYEIKECATAQSGYLKSYQLEKDGVKVGDYINIPKDFLVKSASCKTCTQKDSPVEGYEVGDKYLDFVINVKSGTATDEHLYVLVKDLVDTYTAGNGLTLDGSEFSVDTSVVATQSDLTSGLAEKEDTLTGDKLAAVNSGITSTKVGNYDTHIANSDIHVTAAQKTAWSGKQDALDTTQLAAVNSGVNSTKVATYDGYATTIAAKANSADVYTKTQTYSKSEIDAFNLITYVELA